LAGYLLHWAGTPEVINKAVDAQGVLVQLHQQIYLLLNDCQPDVSGISLLLGCEDLALHVFEFCYSAFVADSHVTNFKK
jgi:hypothetical protein